MDKVELKKNKKRVNFYLTLAQIKKINDEAMRTGLSMSDVVRLLIDEKL